jgi:hypothetical protein
MRWALLAYAAAAIVLLALGLLPHPTLQTTGVEDGDFSAYVWFLEWWPRAIQHGYDPLQTQLVFAPNG